MDATYTPWTFFTHAEILTDSLTLSRHIAYTKTLFIQSTCLQERAHQLDQLSHLWHTAVGTHMTCPHLRDLLLTIYERPENFRSLSIQHAYTALAQGCIHDLILCMEEWRDQEDLFIEERQARQALYNRVWHLSPLQLLHTSHLPITNFRGSSLPDLFDKPFCFAHVRHVDFSRCMHLQRLPESMLALTLIESLSLQACISLEQLLYSMHTWTHITQLTISQCVLLQESSIVSLSTLPGSCLVIFHDTWIAYKISCVMETAAILTKRLSAIASQYEHCTHK